MSNCQYVLYTEEIGNGQNEACDVTFVVDRSRQGKMIEDFVVRPPSVLTEVRCEFQLVSLIEACFDQLKHTTMEAGFVQSRFPFRFITDEACLNCLTLLRIVCSPQPNSIDKESCNLSNLNRHSMRCSVG